MLLAGGLLAGMLLAACTGPGPVMVAPPVSQGTDTSCSRLRSRLPDTVNGHARRTTKPRSDRVAAWGDPAIVLRCGVPRPSSLGRGDVAPFVANGVAWLQHIGGDTVDFTAVDRPVFVEVAIPKKYEGQSGILTDLSDVVSATMPERPLPQ